MLNLGATVELQSTKFRLWAPYNNSIKIIVQYDSDNIQEYDMKKTENGFFEYCIDLNLTGKKYSYKIDGKCYPDPVSRFLPDGVFGQTEIIDPYKYTWEYDNFNSVPLNQLIIYELHTGTFSKEGTFKGIIDNLTHLVELGINCIELMPVAQFSQSRNWGYDGVSLYAVQNSYGSCDDLRELIDRCHSLNIAVILDVVYNHFGPEGNFYGIFGEYFKESSNPWGKTINYDGNNSRHVRDFFISNVIYWLEEYHIDGFRFDAIHGIDDSSKYHILSEISDNIKRYSKKIGKPVHLIAESNMNDTVVLNSTENDGYGMDSQWNDDFHHALFTIYANENKGYYSDFNKIEYVEKSIRQAFVYDGIFSTYRNRNVGMKPEECFFYNFITFTENHDHSGNRAYGERYNKFVDFNKVKSFSALTLLLPYIPMIFMGMEYNEDNPFVFFVDHKSDSLKEAVKKGRLEEFKTFGWESIPDPYSIDSFLKSKIDISKKYKDNYKEVFDLHKDCIEIRKKYAIYDIKDFNGIDVTFDYSENVLTVYYPVKKIIIKSSFSGNKTKLNDINGKIIFSTEMKKYGGKKREDNILKAWETVIYKL